MTKKLHRYFGGTEAKSSDSIRLDNWFSKHPNINPYYFFEAYYSHLNGKIPDFSCFLKHKALRLYINYVRLLKENPFNHKRELDHLLLSFKFVKSFCKKHKISVNNYQKFAENGKAVPSCIIHYKINRINLTTLFALNCFRTIEQVYQDSDLTYFYFGNLDLYQKAAEYRRNFKLEKSAKNLFKKVFR